MTRIAAGPNELSTNRADCVPEVLGPNGLPKGVCWYNRVSPGAPNSIVSIRDPAVHRVRRKVWDRALSAPSIREHWGAMVLRRVGQLVGHLEGLAVGDESGVVDMSGWMSNFAFDIMGDMSCVFPHKLLLVPFFIDVHLALTQFRRWLRDDEVRR